MTKKKQNVLDGWNYNKLSTNFYRGNITEAFLRAQYTKIRNTVTRQQRRIKKSDVPYIDENSSPVFKTEKQLKTISDLLHEFAEMNRYRKSAYYSLEGRRQARDRTIETMRARGFNVTLSNWLEYVAFMRWFRANINQLGDDSDSRRVREFFNSNVDKVNSKSWQELYEEWEKRGKWGQ